MSLRWDMRWKRDLIGKIPINEIIFCRSYFTNNSICWSWRTLQQWNSRKFSCYCMWKQSSFHSVSIIIWSPQFYSRSCERFPSCSSLFTFVFNVHEKAFNFHSKVIKKKTKFDPYSVHWVHLSWPLWNEMMVMIGMYSAFLQHLFPNESIEICITFQVPLILHLEVGASLVGPLTASFALPYLRH